MSSSHPRRTEHAAERPAGRAAPLLRGRLDWRQLLDWLHEDGWIDADDLERVAKRLSAGSSTLHALVRLGGAGLVRRDTAGAGRALEIGALTEWLAGRAQLPHQRIDPLKADAGRVAEVMSAQYAQMRHALPIKVGATEVIIATAEPFDIGWVPEIENHLRRPVRLVVANPEELRRYTAEFYALARSVRAAHKSGEVSASASFEQLVELGKAKGTLDANDQGVVQVVDWLWQYAFDQRASDIHLEPRREIGAIRFRIDGVLNTVYQVPLPVLAAMTSRIKLLGRMDVVEKRRPLDGRIKTRRPDTAEGPGGDVGQASLPLRLLLSATTGFSEKHLLADDCQAA